MAPNNANQEPESRQEPHLRLITDNEINETIAQARQIKPNLSTAIDALCRHSEKRAELTAAHQRQLRLIFRDHDRELREARNARSIALERDQTIEKLKKEHIKHVKVLENDNYHTLRMLIYKHEEELITEVKPRDEMIEEMDEELREMKRSITKMKSENESLISKLNDSQKHNEAIMISRNEAVLRFKTANRNLKNEVASLRAQLARQNVNGSNESVDNSQ